MFPLGHIGIGRQLIPARLRDRLSFGWLALGCLLPDLIDKPLWFAQRAGLLREAFWFLGGTRMVGHTLLALAMLGLLAWLSKSPALIAVALGTLTHAAIDLAGDIAGSPSTDWRRWLLWPFFGLQFEPASYESVYNRLITEPNIYLTGEVVGGFLLLGQYLQWRRARQAPPRDAAAR